MSDPVLALLQDNNISYTVSGRDYLIRCLNPEHDDSNPSCRVDRVNGLTHCFACGFKRNLFKHFGIFNSNVSIRTAGLKEKLKELRVASTSVEMPEGAIPFTKNFRGISTATFKHFGAFYTNSIEKLADRVVFPITDITGKTVVFQARHILSDGNPKYVFYPGGRTPPCFPSILEHETKELFLVEGIFDMLNLYDKGLHNVSCVFGTDSLKNSAAERLMPFKAQGVQKIFILFDGDIAGRSAAKEIKPIIEKQGFIVEIINLEDDTDPGSFNQEYVDSLKEYK